jgi:hypothetical protein
MMTESRTRALALALCLAAPAAALPAAAATPAPHGTPPPMPHIKLPTEPLHSEFVVEVNKKGQVVRVKSLKGTGDKNPFFNAETYGNVLQMWIRHPDGTAQVGLYRVTYDYDPKTHKIARNIAIVSPGGNWGDDPGAATKMVDDAKKRAEEEAKRQSQSLPPLQSIVGPSSSPTHQP